jgi:hypothetical protein
MPEQSISVEFRALCEAVSVTCSISIEHDDILNQGSSEFQVGNQIFYRVYPFGTHSFYLSLGGTISTVTPKKIEEKVEEVTFNGSDKVNLAYPLGGAFSYKWIGSALQTESPHSKCTPKVIAEFDSATLTANESVYGILEVTYEYTYASVCFMPALSGKQIVLVCRECGEEEVCDSTIEEIADQAFDDVTLTISDACESGIKVLGAQVEVNGELIDSVTNEEGQIHIGLLAKGTHTIKVTASGYVDSDADFLSNDVIVVE